MDVRHLTLEQVLGIARTAVGGPIEVRDLGLLESAVHRPQATMFGQPAYPDVWHMAAALLHSLGTSHPLVEGNKPLTWLGTWAFLAKNGQRLAPEDDDAYDLVIAVADGTLSDVDAIAERLAAMPREDPPAT